MFPLSIETKQLDSHTSLGTQDQLWESVKVPPGSTITHRQSCGWGASLALNIDLMLQEGFSP